jgi:serine/threonine protein kinase
VQLLRGMRALHCAWVVHRDLKLPNLLLSKDGVLKVCDFGLSRFQVRTQLSSVHRGTHAHTAAGRTSWLRFSAKDPLNSAFLDGGRTAPTPVCCAATHPPCSPAASAGLGHEGVVHAGRGEPVVPVARAAAGRHALRHGGAHNSCAPEATAFISLCGNPVSISSVLVSNLRWTCGRWAACWRSCARARRSSRARRSWTSCAASSPRWATPRSPPRPSSTRRCRYSSCRSSSLQ